MAKNFVYTVTIGSNPAVGIDDPKKVQNMLEDALRDGGLDNEIYVEVKLTSVEEE